MIEHTTGHNRAHLGSSGGAQPKPSWLNVSEQQNATGSTRSADAVSKIPGGAEQGSVQILLVDDEPDIVEELGEFLEAQGFSWVGAYDASSARERFAEHPDIALVITDLAMPGESGLVLVESLETTYFASRPFASIVVTAHHNEQTMLGSMQKGVRDFIGKPVDLDRLVSSVRSLSAWVRTQRQKVVAVDTLGDKIQAVEAQIGVISRELRNIRPEQEGEATPDGAATDGPISLPQEIHDKLTNRQREVLGLVSKGLSNYEIGFQMGISENTVKLYVSQILKATRCRNRTQLALAARYGFDV